VRAIIVAATMLLTLFVAPSSAQAETCLSTDRFTGSVANMRHWLTACKGVPYDVITLPDPTLAVAVLAAPTVESYDANGNEIATAPGGPSCRWLASDSDGVGSPPTSVVKACYSNGDPHMVCSKWFGGQFYPYHCGPLEAYSLSHAQSLLDWIESSGMEHGLKACAKGTVAGGVAATIMRVAGGTTGPIGIFASVIGGCIGGIVTWWWK
jgi:hypothetical protein